jgi:hypothetical protein
MDTFLNSKNLEENFKFVINRVRQDTGVDLAKYNGMDRQFQKMATILANKSEHQNNTLSMLNTKLMNEATSFFAGQINKKKAQAKQSHSQQPETERITTQYNPDLGFSTLAKNDDVAGSFANLLASRQAQEQRPAVYDMPMGQSGRDANKQDTSDLNKALQNILLERGQINETSGLAQQVPKVLPFNLSDDVTNMLSSEPGIDLPLFQNILDLQNSEELKATGELSTDVLMKRVAELEQTRLAGNQSSNGDILNFQSLGRDAQSRAISKMTARKGESNQMLDRNNTDAQTIFMSQAKEPAELYRVAAEGTQNMINRINDSRISGNDVRSLNPLVDNILVEKLLSLQRELQPKYTERTNYIIVNSVDRDWFRTSESRYNFKVNFKPNSTYTGAGIIDLYKNVTSVELVNAIIPQDCVNLPFDSRVYIDILNFPYLLLQIPEFSDVFRGTNSHNDRAFSVLIFDKQHDSSVLSSDFISGASSIVNSTPTSQFYREYRKTFYKYTPAYFEKKSFQNMPLASLSHMTLILNTPAGENLNTLDDVLRINTIQASTALGSLGSTLEYDSATSYPNDASNATRNYVRINTSTSFSSKLFRLGDLIRIQGYDITGAGTDNTRFEDFINREEGHYILNLDYSNISLSNSNANQGYISNLYIAPPGDLNTTLSGLDSTTYYINGGQINFTNYTSNTAKLINTALQTHYLFKITTREGDVRLVTQPMNV